MRRIIWLSLAALAVCGFGAGPFWGQSQPVVGGGSDPAISGTPTSHVDSNADLPSISTSHAAAGADMLLVVACGLRHSSSTKTISGSTAATFNGDATTQLVFVNPVSTLGAYVDCGLWVLDSPDQGSYTASVTYDASADSGWLYVANLVNTAATQDGDTDTHEDAPVLTTAITVTPSAAGNLVLHVGTIRGGDNTPCSTDLTEILDGITGTNTYTDFAFCVGSTTAADTDPISDTITFSGANDRVAGMGVVIK